LQGVQGRIQQFEPWFDDTFRDLAILRQLTLAFPEDGVVTAKTITIQEGSAVSCSGNAQDNASLLAMQAKLSAAAGVSGFKWDLIHGKAPRQFTFDFQYGNGGAQ
jgi:Tfp pilus assembly protein PilN